MLNLLSAIHSTAGVVGSDFESIATLSGTGSSNTISFTSIPSTYTHLQFRVYATSTGAADWVNLKINNDATVANYYTHRITGNGTAASAGTGSGQAYMYLTFIGGDTSNPGVAVMDILDYANTNKNKTLRTLMGIDANGSGTVGLVSGAWFQTTAINRVDFILASSNFGTATRIALYGIKG